MSEWGPGRWWRVIARPEDRDGVRLAVRCETSDEGEARAAMREGDRLQRMYQRIEQEWRDE